MQKGKFAQWLVASLLVVLSVALLLPCQALAAPVLVDSYPETNWDWGWILLGGVEPEFGQSFLATEGTLDSAKFYLAKQGAPVGNVYAVLYATTGTHGVSALPTGAPLAVSAPVDATTLHVPTSYDGNSRPLDMALATFTFASPVSLTPGTTYMIAVRYEGTDSNNCVWLAVDTSAPAHAGNEAWLSSGVTWQVDLSEDVIFYVYENPPAPEPVSTPASSVWSLTVLASFGMAGVATLKRRRTA